MRLRVHVKGQRRAVWGSVPGPLSPSAVGQGRTESEPSAPDTSPVPNGAGESSPNHGEGWEAPNLPMKRYAKQGCDLQDSKKKLDAVF